MGCRNRSLLAVVGTAALGALACSDTAPEATAVPTPSDLESAALVHQALEAVDELPAVETPAPAVETPEPPAVPPAAAPTAAARKPSPRAKAKPKPAAPPVAHVPLETLLKTTGATGPPVEPPLDLGAIVEESTESPSPNSTSVLDPWKERVHVERRSEPIGRAGPRQGTHSETEASVRIPVDEAVTVEGGVRVDSRSEPGLDEPQRDSIPRVGVEVKF
jgi:hypothetical protein